uniref:Uncharacterized protein n=1 Tax=Glossina austeni TaxID=7395 RepID=A0A1A9UXJ8_GLOAU
MLKLRRNGKIDASPIYRSDYDYLDLADTDSHDYKQQSEPVSNDMLEWRALDLVERKDNNSGDDMNGRSSPCSQTQKQNIPATRPATSSPITKEMAGKCRNETVQEAQDIIEHVTNLIKSMRGHVMALTKNMNDLETDIMTSSDDSKNFSSSGIGPNNNAFPDVGSQTPTYMINEWAVPVKNEKLNDTSRPREFIPSAEDAVRFWKSHIEASKRILDATVKSALRNSNLKSNIISHSRAYPSKNPGKSYPTLILSKAGVNSNIEKFIPPPTAKRALNANTFEVKYYYVDIVTTGLEKARVMERLCIKEKEVLAGKKGNCSQFRSNHRRAFAQKYHMREIAQQYNTSKAQMLP